MEPSDIFNLGALGRFYSARNVLGFYRCAAAVSVCTYDPTGLTDADAWFKEQFSQALYRTVHYHPSLCYGIVDKTAEREAVFLRLQHIRPEDIAEFCGPSPEEAVQNDDEVIVNLLEKLHERILAEGDRKPAWRIIVYKHGSQWDSGYQASSSHSQKISMVFLANHAIADGLSHVNFHRSLIHHFNSSYESGQVSWPLSVPRSLRTPILLEDAVDLLAKDEVGAPQISYDSTTIWSGEHMFLPSVNDYESGLRLITIPPEPLGKLLLFCRAAKITVTGLLHSLIVNFLAKVVPPNHGFRAVTPYSMRYLSKVAEDEICNHVSALVQDWGEPLVNAHRQCTENSKEEIDLLITTAQEFQKNMAAELARSPKNNVWAGMVGDHDWYAQAISQLGKKRALTYELSNIGNRTIVSNEQSSQNLRTLNLEKMLVSQCGSVTGPVVECSCLSIAGGPMTMTLAWQKGSVDVGIIDGMAEFLTKRLLDGFNDVFGSK